MQRPGQGPARGRVFDIVVRQAGRFPDLELLEPDVSGLDERDAALLHAIYDATIRRWLTIEHLLLAHLTKDWARTTPQVKSALMVGAAQLVFLDRVPPHAAVGESVEWTMHRATQRAGGLVNAILRKISETIRPGAGGAVRGQEIPPAVHRDSWTDQRDEIPLPDGRALVLHRPEDTPHLLPLDRLERLAVATSHPLELLRVWMKSMPMRDVQSLALHGCVLPPVILNTQHAVGELPGSLVPHSAPGHHVYTGTHGDLVRLLSRRDDLWVQDPASSLAVGSVVDLAPKVVVDMCAGQGTKTRQLAAAFPGAEVVATDVDTGRRATLRGVFRNHERVKVIKWEELIDWAGKADLVLTDVPCSNTGVLARRCEARYRYSAKRTEELTSVQRQIVADSIRLLGPGGKLLYSTCSLDPEENTAIAKWAGKWHNLGIEREHRREPQGLPGESAERYSDGSYAALLG